MGAPSKRDASFPAKQTLNEDHGKGSPEVEEPLEGCRQSKPC